MPPKFPKIAIASAFLSLSGAAHGLIIFGDVGGVSNPYESAPPNGAPWNHVARVGSGYNGTASAVYLGNRYFLTARHAGVGNPVHLNGIDYTVDNAFGTVQLADSPDGVDAQMFRIMTDPGLAFLPLALPTTTDLSSLATMIGYGVGKGTSAGTNSWNWSVDASNFIKRWGTNTTLSFTTAITPSVPYNYGYTALNIRLNSNVGNDEAAVTLGDSGSGVFVQISGVWTLIGIPTLAGNPSSFSPAGTATNQFVRLREYAHNLRLPNWKAKFLGNANASDTDDTDHDRMNAVLEYALGGDPTIPDASRLPVVGSEGNDVTLTFFRRMTAVDLVYEVWESPDLVNWTKATPTLTQVDTTGMVRRTKANVPKGTGDQKFLQLRVITL